MSQKIITANNLGDGLVVFLDASGGWTTEIAESRIIGTGELDEALAYAKAQHDAQIVVEMSRRLQQIDDGHQLALVVGAVRPAAGGPAVVVDVPGPAGRTGVAEGGAVGGCDDRHVSWGSGRA